MKKKPIVILVIFSFVNFLYANSSKDELKKLFDKGEYSMVIEQAIKTLETNSNSFQAWYYKGLSENALYKFSNAVNSFENAVNLTEDKTLVLFLLGNAEESAGNNVKAISTYKSLIDIDSLYIPAKARLAKVYKSQKDYVLAIELFSDLVKLDSTNGYFYSQLAYCCNKFGLEPPVIDYYKKAIELNPFDLESGRLLISELIDQKYYEGASAYSDTFLLRFPNNIKLLKQKAYIAALGGNYLDAVNDFEKVTQLGDSSLFTCKYYGQSLYNNGEYGKAVFWLGRFLHKKPDDFQNQLIMGLACQNDYQYKKSVYHLNNALLLQYDKKMVARIFIETGNTYVKYGDYYGFRDSTGIKAAENYKLALDNYLLAQEQTPDNFKIYRTLGSFYETKLKDAKVALYYYKKYYKEMDTDQIDEEQLVWIQSKISKLTEEVHFIGE